MKIIIEGDKRFLNDFIKQAKNKSGVSVEVVTETNGKIKERNLNLIDEQTKEEKAKVKTKEQKAKTQTK